MSDWARASADAPATAAFFDLDGTLLPAPSLEWQFIGYLLGRDQITTRHVLRWLGHWAKQFPINPRAAARQNKHYLAGLPESLVDDWTGSSHFDSIGMFPHGLARLTWHLAQQHRVFFVSGTLAPLARALARRISAQIVVIATELQISGGRFTGRLAGEHICGKAKRSAISTRAARDGLCLNFSYAYGNDTADLQMFESVGKPYVVNPSARLRRIAARRGWPACDWVLGDASAAESARCLAEKEAQ
jgi:putative phosphoserine phosphatase / 1-acylglycerol-3-phosphate O-acyltransferase